MRKIFFLVFVVFNTFAIGTYSTIESGVTIYSEYYPNTKAKFKGTIVFENGAGSDLKEWTQNQFFLIVQNNLDQCFYTTEMD